MPEDTIPEIKRTNLANTALYLKILGVHDVLGFEFFEPPPQDLLLDALHKLCALGALDYEGIVTDIGKDMANFPLEPPLSRVLLEGEKRGCIKEVCHAPPSTMSHTHTATCEDTPVIEYQSHQSIVPRHNALSSCPCAVLSTDAHHRGHAERRGSVLSPSTQGQRPSERCLTGPGDGGTLEVLPRLR